MGSRLRSLAALAASVVAAGSVGCTPSGSRAGPPAGATELARFAGQVDGLVSGAGAGGGRIALTLVDGDVSIVTVGGVSTADDCGGPSFEGIVRITNNSTQPLQNVYAQIYSMSQTGREACNGDPENGSTVTWRGFWGYGTIAGNASVDRLWRMKNPSPDPYTFDGHVFTVASPGPTFYASGNGHGWAAQLQNLYADSGAGVLTVTLKMSPIDGITNNIWILVDDTSQPTGFTDLLNGDPTGWGGLAIANAVGLNVDFAYSGHRGQSGGNLASNNAALKWVSGVSTSVAASLSITQDDVNGVYTFGIPYASIGAGAAPGHAVRVHALYGQSWGGCGIHSAAPGQGAVQVALMNDASCSTSRGLGSLDTAAPDHVLR